MIVPIHERNPSKPFSSTNTIEHHTSRNTDDRPIRSTSSDTGYRTNSHRIPAIGNNGCLRILTHAEADYSTGSGFPATSRS